MTRRLSLWLWVGCLPLLASAQPDQFAYARLRYHKQQGQRYVRLLKLFAQDSRYNVVLRYRDRHPDGRGRWLVLAEHGGDIRILGWRADSLCALSAQQQRYAQVMATDSTLQSWLLQTPSDTFLLGQFQPGDTHRCQLSQRLLTPTGSHTQVPLMRFGYDPQARKWLEIEHLHTLEDIPAQVRILACLLAALRLSTLSLRQE